jgi:stage II sporulation protein D
MVISSVKVQLVHRGSSAQPDEVEIAAAVSAVVAYMQTDSIGQRASGPTVSGTAGGGWRAAARLEGSGSRRLIAPPSAKAEVLWRLTPLILLAALWMMTTNSAWAQKLDSWADASADSEAGQSRDSSSEDHLDRVAMSADKKGFTPASDLTSGKTMLRIGLVLNSASAEIVALDGAQIRDAKTGSLVATLPANSQWSVDLKGTPGNLQLAFAGRRRGDLVGSDTGYGGTRMRNVAYLSGRSVPMASQLRLPLRLSASGQVAGNDMGPRPQLTSYVLTPPGEDQSAGVIAVNGKVYRGSIWLTPSTKTAIAQAQPIDRTPAFNVVNLIDLEDYLLSVLPSEMPSGWPLEALKAQAIAARSYAVANIGKHGTDGYDLKATIEDQVYSGVSTENENSNQAVAETNGLVLKQQGKPIAAFFHSTSGGSTELAEHVWGKPLSYLRAVPDYDDSSPHFSWTRRFSVPELEKALPDIGRVLSLSVVSRTPSNRAQYVLVNGTDGCRLLTGQSIRHICKLPSTLFNIGCEDNGYVFAGRGFGHGLGMSQYGARAFADQGYNAAQILSYYYKDVIVDFIAATPGI